MEDSFQIDTSKAFHEMAITTQAHCYFDQSTLSLGLRGGRREVPQSTGVCHQLGAVPKPFIFFEAKPPERVMIVIENDLCTTIVRMASKVILTGHITYFF
jgi:hypothetical protein